MLDFGPSTAVNPHPLATATSFGPTKDDRRAMGPTEELNLIDFFVRIKVNRVFSARNQSQDE